MTGIVLLIILLAMPETVQEPPPLTQDPEETLKTVVFEPKKELKITFDLTKVLAAVGLILTGTIIVVAGMWIWIQTLESRVEGLEENLKVVTSKTVTSSAAKTPVTSSATPSAH